MYFLLSIIIVYLSVVHGQLALFYPIHLERTGLLTYVIQNIGTR